MVVTHAPMEGLEGPSSLAEKKKKKNRRKITRKKNLASDSHHGQGQVQEDDEMPEASSSHATEKNPPNGLKDNGNGDDELMIDINTSSLIQQMSTAAPVFAPVKPNADKTTLKSETRRIPIPPHRMTPLKKDWLNIFGPLTEILGLQVRMNVQRRCVEIRVRNLFSCAVEEY